MYIDVHEYIYIYTYVYIYTCIIHVYIYICMNMYIYILYIYAYKYIYIYIFSYKSICTCICIWILVTHGLGQVRWTNCIAACDVEEQQKKTALRPCQLEPHLLTGNTPRQQQLNVLKILTISEIIEKCKNQKQT